MHEHYDISEGSFVTCIRAANILVEKAMKITLKEDMALINDMQDLVLPGYKLLKARVMLLYRSTYYD